MASRRWLIGIGAASFRRSIYLIRMASSRRPSLRAHLKPHHKLWLDWDGAFLMGPRYLHFLDAVDRTGTDRKSTRLNSSHLVISYAVFCLKKKTTETSTCKLPVQVPLS